MPIPPKYNTGNPRNDFLSWYNDIAGQISERGADLSFILKFFGSLTAGQKTSIRSDLTSFVNARKADLDEILIYIKTEI